MCSTTTSDEITPVEYINRVSKITRIVCIKDVLVRLWRSDDTVEIMSCGSEAD
jgi:hypothetical protein